MFFITLRTVFGCSLYPVLFMIPFNLSSDTTSLVRNSERPVACEVLSFFTFRFDLMALHDIDTMNYIRDELDKIDPQILLYGEGWTGGASPIASDKLAYKWNSYRFRLLWRGRLLEVKVDQAGAHYRLLRGDALTIRSNGQEITVE